MTENPIRKVLLTIRKHGVRCLLMGGQACVFYGAAEFSRDTDLAVLTEPDNLHRLQQALDELQAEVIAVPPFDIEYLRRGHAVHFRCHHPDAAGMRIDIMSVMRGVDDFPALWSRRSVVEVEPDECYDVMSLADLVQAKKTQRDKDWPMIRRLIEADHAVVAIPDRDRLFFWLRESRTPEMLVRLCRTHAAAAAVIAAERPAVAAALSDDVLGISESLAREEAEERRRDAAYWIPLRQELEFLRHSERQKGKS